MRRHCVRGSPAPAGIDPTSGSRPVDRWRLPRTRGDRPSGQDVHLHVVQAPPHPRGSTSVDPARQDGRPGSPAPAGIDPRVDRMGGYPRRLPRTRGDRPRMGWVASVTPEAPPHPRGSTPALRANYPVDDGSPAPAGIDPVAGIVAGTTVGLPRTRGDRPAIHIQFGNVGGAPPHPRGSTPGGRCEQAPCRGSPAPAGIDPTLLANI